jgi:hypothetical protein
LHLRRIAWNRALISAWLQTIVQIWRINWQNENITWHSNENNSKFCGRDLGIRGRSWNTRHQFAMHKYSLPKYLNNEIERVLKRFPRRVYPNLSYEDAIKTSKLDLLFDRRTAACLKLFEEAQMTDHKLHLLVPEKKVCLYSLRLRRCSKFHPPRIRTDGYKNSFIIANSLQQ